MPQARSSSRLTELTRVSRPSAHRQKSMLRGCDVQALQRNPSLLDGCAVGAQRGLAGIAFWEPVARKADFDA